MLGQRGAVRLRDGGAYGGGERGTCRSGWRGEETDSGRYLGAGAVRSFWVRTRQGDLAEAMPRIRKELERAENAIIESNSILRFLRPDLYLSVLDPGTADFKESAKRYLDRADAVLVPEGEIGRPEWKGVSLRLVEGTPVLAIRPPVYVTEDVVRFVVERLSGKQQGPSGGTG